MLGGLKTITLIGGSATQDSSTYQPLEHVVGMGFPAIGRFGIYPRTVLDRVSEDKKGD